MARLPGRNGRLYVGIASGGTAEPIAFLSKWKQDANVDQIDVTAWGDSNKVNLAGLPDAKGTFAGFYDNATAQLYTAAVDGVARKFYWYPDTLTNTQYFFGTAIFDFSIESSVDGSVDVSGNWAATSAFSKQG